MLGLVLLLGLLPACESKHDPSQRKRLASGEYITHVRGVRGLRKTPELEGTPSYLGGGPAARILIQPLEKRLTRGHTIWALYVRDPQQVQKVRLALLAARPAPYRTCAPTWRIDVRYGSHQHVARLNVPCRRLELDGRDLDYSGPVEKVLKPLIRLAIRAPKHKILRIRVPVQHDPKLILKALSTRTIEAYLPRRPAPRGPRVQMVYNVMKRAPSNPARYDEAVAELRTEAYQRLSTYGRQLMVSRHEVIGVWGPEPVYERFKKRLFEARYRVTVLFNFGTPEYMLGFLGLGNSFVVEKVTHPKYYRIDAVFEGKTRMSRMRKVLKWVPVKPPLTRW